MRFAVDDVPYCNYPLTGGLMLSGTTRLATSMSRHFCRTSSASKHRYAAETLCYFREDARKPTAAAPPSESLGVVSSVLYVGDLVGSGVLSDEGSVLAVAAGVDQGAVLAVRGAGRVHVIHLLRRDVRRRAVQRRVTHADQQNTRRWQTWNWVIGSPGHLGHLSRPGHRVIILTRCETIVCPVFEKNAQNDANLAFWRRL